MKKDEHGNRMKLYEKHGIERFMPLLPVCARLDGKCFSKFTKGFDRPFDSGMINLMQHVTEILVAETCADIGYTQSDEISLIWKNDKVNSQIFFDSKIQKMVSVLASMCTAYFNANAEFFLPHAKHKLALFDCRAWQVPNITEASNVLLWREKDATKNSVSMLGHEYFSHKQLHKKTANDIQNMLLTQHDVNWSDYPNAFKRGTYVVRNAITSKPSTEEIKLLSPKHNAHNNPDFKVTRHVIEMVNFPPMGKVINRNEVYFEGVEPKHMDPYDK